ncbi:hypothetical protein GCM10009007_05730 [Formosimonas limnophila]|uniref:Uncharacterized protein n=1 Tax=Formosimonas limnophila TaxID=1384487 RepID=A0A8J3G0B9_9BURK|nr:hypothetical protein [Formosimonas limnophila]GHA68010.1 hypothetical protein GCM10009007_05730 [Formosimonas limnophila]
MKVQNILKIASFLLFSGAALTAAVYAKDLNGTNQSPQPFKSRISSVVTEREVIDGKERQSKYMVAILSSDNGSMMSKILHIQPNKPGDPTFIPFSTTVYFDNDGCSYGSIDIGFVDSISKGMSQKEKELLRNIYEKKIV